MKTCEWHHVLLLRDSKVLVVENADTGFVAVVFANNAYLSWAPKFVARKFGLSVCAAGNGTMLYHHIAAFGVALAAYDRGSFRQVRNARIRNRLCRPWRGLRRWRSSSHRVVFLDVQNESCG